MFLKRNPILVTGAPRSGSTWLGKMLSLSESVIYIHEPFNKDYSFENSPIKYWFEYVSGSDTKSRQKKYSDYFKSIIGIPIKYLTIGLIKSVLQLKPKRLKNQCKSIRNRFMKRYLVKDPISIFSADWIANSFNMDVVVIIRHPAAFVASFKVKNWRHDFNDFLNQEKLMQDVLKDYTQEIYSLSNQEEDIIEHAILLWNVIHHRIKKYQENNKNWTFVRHEDISINPVDEFATLYRKLNLKFDDSIKNEIFKYTEEDGNNELIRNSRENITSWKSRLTKNEILRVRNGTEKISNYFYADNEW